MVKFAIIGSKGFLGSYICKECQKIGIDFVPLSRTEWNKLLNDKIENWFHKEKITDVIFCCGFSQRFDPQEIEKIDELETVNLILKKTDTRLIYLSSALVYGFINDDLNLQDLAETSDIAPTGAYGMYKRIIERLVLQTDEKNCVMRLVSCIGKNKKSGLMKSIESQIISKKSEINMLHGNTIRDYIWVGNAAKLIIYLTLNKENKGIFNIGSGKGVEVSEIVNKFAEFYKSNIKKITFGELMVEDPKRLVLNVCKTKQSIPDFVSNEVFASNQIDKYLEEM